MGKINDLIVTVGEMVQMGLSDSDIAEMNHITIDMVREIVTEWYPSQDDQNFAKHCHDYDQALSFQDCE